MTDPTELEQAVPSNTVLLLVDAQTSFVAQMAGEPGPVLTRLEALLCLCRLIGLPVLVTVERPVSEKGDVHPRLVQALPAGAPRIEKSTFDAMAEAGIPHAIAALERRHVVVAGAETDVCVLLTVLGLLRKGYRVTVLTDCVFSSAPDASAAVRRMERAGAVCGTYKTLAYELTATVDRSRWPEAWRRRLADLPDLFPPPESLPS